MISYQSLLLSTIVLNDNSLCGQAIDTQFCHKIYRLNIAGTIDVASFEMLVYSQEYGSLNVFNQMCR